MSEFYTEKELNRHAGLVIDIRFDHTAFVVTLNDSPLGVYSTLEKAKAAVDAQERTYTPYNYYHRYYRIIGYYLD